MGKGLQSDPWITAEGAFPG